MRQEGRSGWRPTHDTLAAGIVPKGASGGTYLPVGRPVEVPSRPPPPPRRSASLLDVGGLVFFQNWLWPVVPVVRPV